MVPMMVVVVVVDYDYAYHVELLDGNTKYSFALE